MAGFALPIAAGISAAAPYVLDSIFGGDDGVTILKEFFTQLRNYIDNYSVIFFVASSLGKTENFFPAFSNEYHFELIQSIHMFFEDFGLFRAQIK